MKYVIVIGGVMSGIGKGVTASSIGVLFQQSNFDVTAIKIDPYLNINAGLMAPDEHGECYVLDDGGECDLDLGNYERFLGIRLTKEHSLTTGKVFLKVIQDERAGKYLGKTVQIVPHITDAIQQHLIQTSQIPVKDGKKPEVCIVELGGTIGDIESSPFVEAIRQFKFKNPDDVVIVHVSYMPYLGEFKTKPAQNGIKKLRECGIIPDMVVLRSINELINKCIKKFSNRCGILPEFIISNPNMDIYKVPELFHRQNVLSLLCSRLKINKELNWTRWYTEPNIKQTKVIGIVGKYTKSVDSYLSLSHAIRHAAQLLQIDVNLKFIEAQDGSVLENLDGVIIPGGFGKRGIEYMIKIAEWCRLNDLPLLGICLGMQVQIIEYYRNVLGIQGAGSSEVDINCKNCVVVPNVNNRMKVGSHMTNLKEGSKIHKIYRGNNQIKERHRHRYHIINYRSKLDEHLISGYSGDGDIDVFELPSRFYIGCQFHPEFVTTHKKPHPLFTRFVEAL